MADPRCFGGPNGSKTNGSVPQQQRTGSAADDLDGADHRPGGAVILACAFLIEFTEVDLPYKGLFVYTGVATLLTGVGATAAVLLNLPHAGQQAVVGGAAAVSIALCWMIGPDKPARMSRIYYVNFPDAKVRSSADLTAWANIEDEQQNRHKRSDLALALAPSGIQIKLTLPDVRARDYVTLEIHSKTENKTWTSASVLSTEWFMNFYGELWCRACGFGSRPFPR